MIPQNVIQEILDKVSIIDIIGRYTEIKRSGRNALALCPFHQEKTPSFSISEEKGLYHCFGCGASGNTVRFLMDHQKMTFIEAIQELSKVAGVDLEKYNESEDFFPVKEKEMLIRINREAMMYFHKILLTAPEADDARKYLKGRKITLETVKSYRLGFGGNDWNVLCNHLNEKGFTEEEMIKAGLSSKGRQGVYDRFKDRIIFPILDRDGNPVGFGGRVLSNDKKTAKYLNTAENPLFHKGSLLFSLNTARDWISKFREVLLVEGYMDVIALSQNGIRNAVAPLGTALTENQLSIIKRYCDTIYFIFDGDGAGITAANRALDIAVGSELTQWVVILPDKKDPYDYAMEFGRDGFLKYAEEKRLSPIDFKIRYFSGKMNVKNDKLKFLLSLFPYFSKVKSPVVREGYIRKVSGFIEEDYLTVLAEYNNFLKRDKNLGKSLLKKNSETDSIHPLEAHFASFLLLFPEKVSEIGEIISGDMIRSKEVKNILDSIKNNPVKSGKEMVQAVQDQQIMRETARLAQMEGVNPRRIHELAYRIKHIYLKREIDKISSIIAQNDKSGNGADSSRLLDEKRRLVTEEKIAEESWKSFESLE